MPVPQRDRIKQQAWMSDAPAPMLSLGLSDSLLRAEAGRRRWQATRTAGILISCDHCQSRPIHCWSGPPEEGRPSGSSCWPRWEARTTTVSVLTSKRSIVGDGTARMFERFGLRCPRPRRLSRPHLSEPAAEEPPRPYSHWSRFALVLAAVPQRYCFSVQPWRAPRVPLISESSKRERGAIEEGTNPLQREPSGGNAE